MKKYFTVFKTSWANELEYRLAFVLTRFRNIVFLLLLYYVWMSLSQVTGRFASYSTEELTTYVFGAHLLRAVIFGSQSRLAALEINDGTFSTYLVKPVAHFWFVYWRELAQRVLFFITAVCELFIFIFLTKAHFLFQQQAKILILVLVAVAGAHFLYFILSYLVSLLAFWSREAMGPRFLFEWFLEFSSGAFFPLDILSKTLLIAFQFLPFAYLFFFPLSLYLGKIGPNESLEKILIQFIWLAAVGFFTYFVWRRGLRRYSGEGI